MIVQPIKALNDYNPPFASPCLAITAMLIRKKAQQYAAMRRTRLWVTQTMRHLASRHANWSVWRLGHQAAGGGGRGCKGGSESILKKRCWRQPAELFASSVGRSDNCGGSNGSHSSAGSARTINPDTIHQQHAGS